MPAWTKFQNGHHYHLHRHYLFSHHYPFRYDLFFCRFLRYHDHKSRNCDVN